MKARCMYNIKNNPVRVDTSCTWMTKEMKVKSCTSILCFTNACSDIIFSHLFSLLCMDQNVWRRNEEVGYLASALFDEKAWGLQLGTQLPGIRPGRATLTCNLSSLETEIGENLSILTVSLAKLMNFRFSD